MKEEWGCFVNYKCTFLDCAPIELGDGVWIGANVTIGKNCIEEGVLGAGPNLEYLSAIKVSVKDKSRFQNRIRVRNTDGTI